MATLEYLFDLEPFRVRDDSTPSGFSLKKVFRGMKLGGFVGKGIVGLRVQYTTRHYQNMLKKGNEFDVDSYCDREPG